LLEHWDDGDKLSEAKAHSAYMLSILAWIELCRSEEELEQTLESRRRQEGAIFKGVEHVRAKALFFLWVRIFNFWLKAKASITLDNGGSESRSAPAEHVVSPDHEGKIESRDAARLHGAVRKSGSASDCIGERGIGHACAQKGGAITLDPEFPTPDETGFTLETKDVIDVFGDPKVAEEVEAEFKSIGSVGCINSRAVDFNAVRVPEVISLSGVKLTNLLCGAPTVKQQPASVVPLVFDLICASAHPRAEDGLLGDVGGANVAWLHNFRSCNSRGANSGDKLRLVFWEHICLTKRLGADLPSYILVASFAELFASSLHESVNPVIKAPRLNFGLRVKLWHKPCKIFERGSGVPGSCAGWGVVDEDDTTEQGGNNNLLAVDAFMSSDAERHWADGADETGVDAFRLADELDIPDSGSNPLIWWG